MMTEDALDNHAWPIRLRLTRKGDTFTTEYSTNHTAWKPAAEPSVVPGIGKRCRVGLAVLSHDRGGLTEASFSDVSLQRD